MQLKGPKTKLKKEDIERIRRTFPVIVAKHFVAIFLAGAVLALLIGVYYFYQNVYVLTGEDYTAFVSVREVNMKTLRSVLEFIESRQVGDTGGSLPSPF